MQQRPQENGTIFLAILLIVVAWRIVTLFGDAVVAMIFAGYLAFAASLMLVDSHRRFLSFRQPYPLTLVPPLWLVAWVALALAVHLCGTPHISLSHGRTGCIYLGWNGVIETPGFGCQTFRFFPTDYRHRR